jgi:hypothetical protein
MVEVRKEEGTPTIKSSAITTITAAMAAPAIFRVLISTFQTASSELTADQAAGSKEAKIIRGDCKDM